MNKSTMRWLAAGMVLAVVGSASGQTAAENEWDLRVTPYFWAIATEGDVGVGSITAPIDMSFSEAWDRLDFGGMLSLEANKGQWIVFLDGTYIRIEDKKKTQLGVVEADLEQSILQAAVGYNVIKDPALSLDLGVGGRYLYTSVDVTTPPGLPDVGRSVDWIDPILVARLTVNFNERCFGVLAGDVGGFGIAADITTQGYALAGYTLSERAALLLGYRYLYTDYQDGDFSYDISTHGYMAGLQIDF